MMITMMMMRIPEDDGDCSEIMIIRMMITTMMMRIPDNDGLYLILFKTMQCLNLENVFSMYCW